MNTQPSSGDLTPEVGAQTDVAPLGRATPKPAHELTAAEDAQTVDWNSVAQSAVFRDLVRTKIRFIVPATAFFFAYYFALPILVGYWPKAMSQKVWGDVNWAYLFALSQFVMAWVLAAVYVKVAASWDRRAAEALAKAGQR